MMSHECSAQTIIEMRTIAKQLFTTGVNALASAVSGTVQLHPRTAQLACLGAVSRAAVRYFETVLAPHAAIPHVKSVTTSELVAQARSAAYIEGPVAIILCRTEKGQSNEHRALSFALEVERSPLHRPWIFLSGATGHRQCRSGSAGAIVDAGTCSWIWPSGKRSGVPNNPSSFLAASGDLLPADPMSSYSMSVDLIILG
ncbi:hypothetical protein [Rhizobium grahamii]|uniref:Hydroxypyruvate reductase n=1 Tax=Rhizobium grahamii CCGE 502 TaxID=990285 RepID=S3HEC4_9HYPH|nr:hypothetical protein [Rhizobium grahamii]EPE96420.1 hydroxypyruvate reductase [Rhizobium grahamii CCGE 502]